jgi:hypothetical protein
MGVLMALKPQGMVPRTAIGYVPFLLLWWRAYSQEAKVRTTMTNALQNVEMKKKRQAAQ